MKNIGSVVKHKVIDEALMEPDMIVDKYYKALYSGDLKIVKNIMTQKSYIMVLESFGLKLSLEDSSFKAELEKVEDDASSLKKVEKALSDDLKSYNSSPVIEISKVESNGSARKTVYYTEDGKRKRLHFSKEVSGWKINYYAGRPIPQSYISSIKKWFTSILPSFKYLRTR